MNPKLKLALMTAALLAFIGSSTGRAHPHARQQRTAQTRAKKSAPSATAVSKASPASGCSLLTPAMIQNIVGQAFEAPTEGKLIPPFGDKWGSHCSYSSQKDGRIHVDFWVYVTTSPEQAKQWFDMGETVNKPKSKLAIGNSAYIDPSNGDIYVLKGKVCYWIAIDPGNDRQLKDLAAAVAAGI